MPLTEQSLKPSMPNPPHTDLIPLPPNPGDGFKSHTSPPPNRRGFFFALFSCEKVAHFKAL